MNAMRLAILPFDVLGPGGGLGYREPVMATDATQSAYPGRPTSVGKCIRYPEAIPCPIAVPGQLAEVVLQDIDDLHSYVKIGIQPSMGRRATVRPCRVGTIGDAGGGGPGTGTVHPKHSGPHNYEFVAKVAGVAAVLPQSCGEVRERSFRSYLGVPATPPGQSSVVTFVNEQESGGVSRTIGQFSSGRLRACASRKAGRTEGQSDKAVQRLSA